MKIGKIIIGSRGSKLALIYAEKAKDALKNVFNGNIEIKKISTTGAEEFFAAHEVKPENVEKLKKSALAEMVTHMKDNGSSLTFSRTLTLDG